MNDPGEAKVSEPDKSYRWDLRIGLAVGALGFLGAQWLLFIKGPGKDDSLFDGILLELLACVLLGVPLFMWKNRKRHAIEFDADGLWLLHVGKQRGLVPWGRIAKVRESALYNSLFLYGATGKALITVEYQREHFLEIRKLVMERMTFRSPAVPSVFRPRTRSRIIMAMIALSMGGLGVSAVATATDPDLVVVILRYVFGPLWIVAGSILAWLSIAPLKVIITRECVAAGRRRYPYSGVQSVSMSFWRSRGQRTPRVWLTLNDGSRRLVPNYGVDSITFQRTLEWALKNWREENGGAGPQLAGTKMHPAT
jgi:hypothetical protein